MKFKVEEVQKDVEKLRKENRSLDKQISAINVDVCEYKGNRDLEFEQREKDIVKIRYYVGFRFTNNYILKKK